MSTHRFSFTVTALAAALALVACGRDERIPLPPPDTPPSTSSGSTTSGISGSVGDASAAVAMIAAHPPGAIGSASTAPLAAQDEEFLTKAAEGGQFELEVAKLAAEKASDPAVKSFAQMLVDDHRAANDKLRQIASSHNLALPASLPDAKKKELEELARLPNAEFERRFVKMADIKDHHHDIAEFEKAGQNAQSEDVKTFAQATVPTLKKHLSAAERLPNGRS